MSDDGKLIPLQPEALAALATPAFDGEAIAKGKALFLRHWVFLKGVVALDQVPDTGEPEIAFAGRSNVGKSSLINAVVATGGLARTSNTPGRTQELNYFTAKASNLLVVDMPGYGYAEAPKVKVDAWTVLIKSYLEQRTTLRRVVLLIDSRHGIKANDLEMMELMDQAAVSYQAVLTKSDKIGANDLRDVMASTRAAIKKRAAAFPLVLTTSSEKYLGIDELRASIAEAVR